MLQKRAHYERNKALLGASRQPLSCSHGDCPTPLVIEENKIVETAAPHEQNARDAGGQAPHHAVDAQSISMVFEGADGPITALDDVSLKVGHGSFVSIVGRSGCGKSTLLRIIAGLIKPSQGCVQLMGRPREDYLRSKRLGFVFQDASLLPWKTVEQNIALPLNVTGAASGDKLMARVAQMLSIVRLEGFGSAYPAHLSGGMRQRVSLARALSYEPEILLMDEPFGALDEFTRHEMHGELIRIWQERPMTVIFVTHSLNEAMALSDRIVVMSARPGRIKAVVDVAQVRPRDRAARTSPQVLAQLAALEDALDAD